MAIPFYNQVDQDIYTGGEHFIPQQDYRLNYTPLGGTLPPSIANASTGITNTQAAYPYIWPPQGGGGGGGADNPFGPNAVTKDFDIQTWDRIGTPVHDFHEGDYGWVDKTVTGYKTPSGWKTKDEKNIINAGIDYTPAWAQAMGFGKKIQGNRPGEIKGTFSDAEDAEDVWDITKQKLKKVNVIRKWKENREIKKQEKIASDKIAADKIVADKITADRVGGDAAPGSTDTSGWDSPGYSTRGGFQKSSPGADVRGHHGAAQGGRIGYAEGNNEKEKDFITDPDKPVLGWGLAEWLRQKILGRGSKMRSSEAWKELNKAQGGRIGLYAGGDPEEPAENMFEFMRDQNIPLSEQVEGEEGILQQLIAKYIEAGFPPDQAEEMAMQEFQEMAMGSEQGIASLV